MSVSGSGVLAAVFVGAAASAGDLTVVELYTSQACPMCPAADALLADLSRREGVLALSFPVSYWDTEGWRDTLAMPENVERQRAYAAVLPNLRVYTPQFVINGAVDVKGSYPEKVEAAIERASADEVSVSFVCSGGEGRAVIGTSPGAVAVTLVSFEKAAVSVPVVGGANTGKTLAYAGVVRDFGRVTTLTAGGGEVTVALPGGAGLDHAILVHEGEAVGRVLGAARCSA